MLYEVITGTVRLYPHGMLHGKAMLVDDTLAVIGSANFDMRSLFLNYETGLLIYSKPEIQEVGDWVQGIAKECRLGVPEVKTLRDT